MISVLLARLRQGKHTTAFPKGAAPKLPELFRGRPTAERERCPEGCGACAAACPTGAIRLGETATVDLGRCLFCPDCREACPEGAIGYSREYAMATRKREDLVVGMGREKEGREGMRLAEALEKRSRRLFGRSLKLREVSAGGCNGCEADVNVLGTIGWDLGRFGVQFVASPRHADGVVITGPVTENMAAALEKTWEGMPGPKLVIAVGACAISGGPYADHPEVRNGAGERLAVDLHVPGCPPHPLTILDGLLRLLGRIEEGKRGGA